MAGAPAVEGERVEEVGRALAEVRAELAAARDLEELDQQGTLRRFRELKRGLERAFFEPGVLAGVLETNAACRDTVERLYARERESITGEYQEVMELERTMTPHGALENELARFHEEVASFERHLEQDELRLDELARLRGTVRSLTSRLTSSEPPRGHEEAVGDGLTAAGGAAGPAGPAQEAPGSAGRELLAASHRRLLEALGGVTLGLPPRTVIHSADLFPFQLEALEVMAYRHLVAAPEGSPHQEIDRFVLEAAALRVGLDEETESGRSLESTQDGFDPARLRRLAALGDAFVRRFENLEQDCLLSGDPDLARSLAYLRVRLTRAWSDAWLLAHEELRRVEE
jgi:hypothetical protein